MACLLISILSWYLGGFFPVIGAPVFAIFIGMLLHPFLSSYKQLDAGLTFSSKNCPSMPLSCLVLVSISRKSSQLGNLHSPVILSTISIALIVAHLFQRFFALDTKLATLIGVGSSICGGLCHCGQQRPLSMLRKRK